ncbi:proline--tRNA ligase [Candidatus Woesearchaeota archaeon]|nr:proline--tRNA ligase [Candidatus Woesearchaeota archaeon]
MVKGHLDRIAIKGKEKERSEKLGITIKKEEDSAEWYAQVCEKGDLAEYAPVKGCYIIKPYGYKIWENIQTYFNKELKRMGISNAYFPLFIPESFFKREAQHARGFSPEVAWIANREEESERIAVRPTSETIMCDSFARWVRSWRDLPLRINQWCNVVRWETKATKLFLRSREFLWQEGHCVYETESDCDRETLVMLEKYKKLAEELLAIPVIYGKKTDREKFAGANYTMTIEAFMPDGKALQLGTSHNLGQGFMKAFNVSFLGKDGEAHVPWHSSWGFSTRLIGAAVLMHSDNKGLVLPPRIAPNKVVIVPIIFDETRSKVLAACDEVRQMLAELDPILDEREEYTPGWKFNNWELRGIPLRVEIGPKDLETHECVLVRRDGGKKQYIKIADIKEAVLVELEEIQHDLFAKAKKVLDGSITPVQNWAQFVDVAKERRLILAAHCGDMACEETIQEQTGGVTTRCVPFGDEKIKRAQACVHCGKPSKYCVYFSKSY